ncbi:hypothetical protein [Hymenobacter jeongseonensis]|uniref:hypothetical protein n=1 Tax=Hymenobacter jeongseonensis TaxID=2791027 RepID=UPI0018AFE233|nr:hypothetical protein [Hymenobacter jeongseonensis]
MHVLDHTSALGPAEVRELEQLAQAFPYCQTAHLLLAKAAHDQGTMLAGQRLRRAATYAADRTLLRRLIEQEAPAPEVASLSTEDLALAVVQEAQAAPQPLAPEPPVSTVFVDVEYEAPTPPITTASEAPSAAPEPEIMAVAPTPVAEVVPIAPEPTPVVEQSIEEVLEAAEAPSSPPAPVESVPQIEELAKQEVPPTPTETEQVLLLDVEGVDIPATEIIAEHFPEPELDAEDILPAQAPAIRPSVEVGEARFEFGLADVPPPAVPAYELPGLVDEWAASAVTRSLGSVELLPEIIDVAGSATDLTPAFTPAAFTGDSAVGYGFGESSRLGFSLQLLNLLADKAEAEFASTEIASAQPAATLMPPAGAFFEPDPLLLDHWATHCPPPPVLPSSLDLINNFLRRQPRLTRPAMLPPPSGAQADLSVRSTRAEPDLVSESLARILVRQGKTARAIEIYEKLMVKQPEKMAYFAAQIQQLQPSA